MNWGKGIIGGMILFMLFIISMCIYMFLLPTDEYDPKYYEKGLAFDKDYNREKQVFKDNAQPKITIGDKDIKLTFAKPAIGSITFLRPSNQYVDRVFKIDSYPGPIVNLPLKSINKGQWLLILEWESDHRSYLYKQEVYIK